MNPIGCALLAGGKCSRMDGHNKAFLKIGDTDFCDVTIQTLKNIFDEVIIVTNSPEEFSGYISTCEIIGDKLKNKGPLGGIYSALSYTNKEALFVVACDMPYLDSNLIVSEINTFSKIQCDALVPRVGNYLEPLHSIFKKKMEEKLYQFLTANQKYYIRTFLDLIDVHYLDIEDNQYHRKAFTNINTPAELERIDTKEPI
jgi:molybdopterin-guanine dinucleotide biosynthesis protein A